MCVLGKVLIGECGGDKVPVFDGEQVLEDMR